jgi:hypothetical protein
MCKYSIEMTDTFSGEANYSWVRTECIDAPCDASSKMLVRRAKKALGISTPHRVSYDSGDMIRIDLRNHCICIFISAL